MGGGAMKALIIKEFRELVRDRRTLTMLVALPVVLLIIFGYAASFRVDRVSVAVLGPGASALSQDIRQNDFGAAHFDIALVDDASPASEANAADLLRGQRYDVVLLTKTTQGDTSAATPLSERMRAYVDGSELFMAQAARAYVVELAASDAQAQAEAQLEKMVGMRADLEQFRAPLEELRTALPQLENLRQVLPQLAQTLDGLSQLPPGAPMPALPPLPDLPAGDALPTLPSQTQLPALPELPELPQVPSLDADSLATVMFNPDLSTAWVMVPPLVGLIMVFIGILITSIGLVREREAGTLEQLAVMPLRPVDIILGKITPYFLLAVLDMAVVTVVALTLFGVPFRGSALLYALGVLLFAFVVLGVGVFISSISQTTGQAIQLAIMMVVPQIILSGLIYPLGTMPAWIRAIGYCLPLTWFRQFSLGVMLRGAGLETMWLPLAIMAAMALGIFGAATARMRYSLAHGGGR